MAEANEDGQAIEAELVAAVVEASSHDWRAAQWLLQQQWPQHWGRRS